MAQFSEVDQSKLPDFKYLGWGVDCRKSEEKWQQNLMSYGGPQIRALEVGQNVVTLPHEEVIKKDGLSKQQKSGRVDVKCSTKIFCELSIGFGSKEEDTNHEYVESRVFKTATLQDDILNDPDRVRVKYGGSNELHSKYEGVLSAYVVKHVQRETRGNRAAVERPRKLTEKNAIAKLEGLIQEGTSDSQKLLVEACTKFVDHEHPYTHYVYSIKRGKRKIIQELDEEEHREMDSEVAGTTVTASAKSSYSDHKSKKQESELGNESLEVIGMNLKPLYTLIKSEYLRGIMETLLKRFDEIKQGMLSGPFTISCLPNEGERVYWNISHRRVNGTTDVTRASEFYIKYLRFNPPQFGILCFDSDKDELYVKFTQTEDSSQHLQVVDTATEPEITFQLRNSLQEVIDLPKDGAGLVKQGRFFLQKCSDEGWLAWIAQLIGYSKPPYVAMVKYECHQYKAKSREKIDEERAGSMLFHLNYMRRESLSSTNSSSKRKRTSTHPASSGPSKRPRMSTNPDSHSPSKRKTTSTHPPLSKKKKTSTHPAPSKKKKTSTHPAPSKKKTTATHPAPSKKKTSTRPAPSKKKKTSTRPAPSKKKKTSTRPAPSKKKKTSTRPAPSKKKTTATRPAPSKKKTTSTCPAKKTTATRPAPSKKKTTATRPALSKKKTTATRPAPSKKKTTSTRPASGGQSNRKRISTRLAKDKTSTHHP